jgi:hypothetical protein
LSGFGRCLEIDQDVIGLDVAMGNPELMHACKPPEELIAELFNLAVTLLARLLCLLERLIICIGRHLSSGLKVIPAEIDRHEVADNVQVLAWLASTRLGYDSRR